MWRELFSLAGSWDRTLVSGHWPTWLREWLELVLCVLRRFLQVLPREKSPNLCCVISLKASLRRRRAFYIFVIFTLFKWTQSLLQMGCCIKPNIKKRSCWNRNILSVRHTMASPSDKKELCLKITTSDWLKPPLAWAIMRQWHMETSLLWPVCTGLHLDLGSLRIAGGHSCASVCWWRPCVLFTQTLFYGAKQEKLLVGVLGSKTCFSSSCYF